MAETETVAVVFENHWRDRRDPDPEKHKDFKPGDRADFDVDLARRFVRAGTAKYATKTAAKNAGDPDGPVFTAPAG